MFDYLSRIVFMEPVILTALIALPVIWYLLRITPPSPKIIFFPAARFLNGLISDEQTPSKTPWWLLLLRLVTGALIIIALAKPVINPAGSLYGKGPVRIIIDNSWAGAQNWKSQIDAGEEIITQAARENRAIYIVGTSPALGENTISAHGPLTDGKALSILRGMTPNPWPANYDALVQEVKKIKDINIHTIWLSHGLDEGGVDLALRVIQNQGSLVFVSPADENLPLLLRPAKKALTKKERKTEGDGIRIAIDAPRSIADNLPVSVQALTQQGEIADIVSVNINSDEREKIAVFSNLEEMKANISRFRISGRDGAGANFVLDDDFKKRHIGIAGNEQAQNNAPLIDDTYYIKRALEPFAMISFGEVKELINSGVRVIIMPDTGYMPAQTLDNLEKWVKNGGLLLRFSGPHLADIQNERFLLPVNLRAKERSLSGSLSWEKPQGIDSFAQDSPFYGLEVPEDINIEQQMLSEPDEEQGSKIWARLQDGTPFVTAREMDKGLIVLIHTTANTDWSNFALSGLYVSVLRRIVRLAGKAGVNIDKNFTTLDPLLVMDGFGNMVSPSGAVHPVAVDQMENFTPSSITPPGLYGNAQTQIAFNIASGDAIGKLKTPVSLPGGVMQGRYDGDYEASLYPLFLYLSVCLFCIDWLIMIFVAGGGANIVLFISGKIKKPLLIFVCALMILAQASPAALAQNNNVSRYANGFFLAHMETGDAELDNITGKGLKSLAKALSMRTSVEVKGVVKLNPKSDILAFFPIIFWPIASQQKIYSDKDMENIQFYLDHGGTIIFDTREKNASKNDMINSEHAKTLRRITQSLDIPPVAPISGNHVLGRTFYLLEEFPGRYNSGTLWVERVSSDGRDNVSSVIIGSNDWAGSWADSYNRQATNRYIDSKGDSTRRQEEMSLRFGVNLVMYALTGNYKADQVHIPHILRRLGQ